MPEHFPDTGEPSPSRTFTRRQLLVVGASIALAGSMILQDREKSSPEVKPHERISLQDLAAHGESLPRHTYMAGETIDWPTPIHIGHDWSLTIDDRPAIQLAHDLVPDGSVVNILSNNILRETPDKFGRDRNNLSLSDSTTMDDGVSVMRVRPALTTEKHIDYFDKITVEVKAPFYQYPNPDKAPSYQFQAPYRLNWYHGQRKETDFVDPEIETVVSERPLNPADYDNLDRLVRLFRTVSLGKTIAFITKGRKLHGLSDYYEANLEDTSGIVAINSYYLSADPRLFKLVANHEFNHSIISSAKQNVNTLDEIKNLRHVFRRLATLQNPAFNPSFPVSMTCEPDYAEVFQLFDESTYYRGDCTVGDPDKDEDELFTSGLNVMRLYPEAFAQFFTAKLSPKQQLEARQVRNGIYSVIHGSLVSKGATNSTLDKFWPNHRALMGL